MSPRAPLAVLLSLTAVLQLAGAANSRDRFQELLDRSPFGNTATNSAAAAPVLEPVEFRAVLEENGRRFFSIYENATHRSYWVNMDDTENGFSVKEYDETDLQIKLIYQGRLLTLPLQRGPKAAIAAAPTPSPVNQPTVPQDSGKRKINQLLIQQLIEQSRLRQTSEPSRK